MCVTPAPTPHVILYWMDYEGALTGVLMVEADKLAAGVACGEGWLCAYPEEVVGDKSGRPSPTSSLLLGTMEPLVEA